MLANRTAEQDSTFTIALVDDAGTAIVGEAASWQLLDDRGVLIASGNVPTIPAQATSVTFAIAGSHLSMPATVSSIGRELVVIVETADGEIELRDYFVVVSPQPVALMQNSFLTYPEALALRQEFASLPGWDANERVRRASAMAEAYRRLCQMSFKVPGARASENTVGYAAYGTGVEEALFAGNRIRVATLTLEQFDALPEPFRRALKRGQMAEANILLGGDPIGDKRKQGIISETIGESSAFFQSKPYLNLPIARETYEELKRYIFLKIGLHRG